MSAGSRLREVGSVVRGATEVGWRARPVGNRGGRRTYGASVGREADQGGFYRASSDRDRPHVGQTDACLGDRPVLDPYGGRDPDDCPGLRDPLELLVVDTPAAEFGHPDLDEQLVG